MIKFFCVLYCRTYFLLMSTSYKRLGGFFFLFILFYERLGGVSLSQFPMQQQICCMPSLDRSDPSKPHWLRCLAGPDTGQCGSEVPPAGSWIITRLSVRSGSWCRDIGARTIYLVNWQNAAYRMVLAISRPPSLMFHLWFKAVLDYICTTWITPVICTEYFLFIFISLCACIPVDMVLLPHWRSKANTKEQKQKTNLHAMLCAWRSTFTQTALDTGRQGAKVHDR